MFKTLLCYYLMTCHYFLEILEVQSRKLLKHSHTLNKAVMYILPDNFYLLDSLLTIKINLFTTFLTTFFNPLLRF